jgi:hypothetical protein
MQTADTTFSSPRIRHPDCHICNGTSCAPLQVFPPPSSSAGVMVFDGKLRCVTEMMGSAYGEAGESRNRLKSQPGARFVGHLKIDQTNGRPENASISGCEIVHLVVALVAPALTKQGRHPVQLSSSRPVHGECIGFHPASHLSMIRQGWAESCSRQTLGIKQRSFG